MPDKPPAKRKTQTKAAIRRRLRLARTLGATSWFEADGQHDQHVKHYYADRIVRSKFPDIEQGQAELPEQHDQHVKLYRAECEIRSKIAALLDATDAALAQLRADRDLEKPNKKAIADWLSAVEHSTARLSEVLAAAPDGLSSLIEPASPSSHRIRHHLADDLRLLRSRAVHTARVIQESSAKKYFEYRCALRIADAWLAATGEMPTLSHNTTAVSGPQATAFQRYMAMAVKPPIGDAIMQDAVAALGELAEPKPPF